MEPPSSRKPESSWTTERLILLGGGAGVALTIAAMGVVAAIRGEEFPSMGPLAAIFFGAPGGAVVGGVVGYVLRRRREKRDSR